MWFDRCLVYSHAMQKPLFNWLNKRSAGVLLHPTSLPGNQGIGTLDIQADRFIDFLQASGISHWQICPLGPTGYGDSPYQCFSAFAGNPYLIDLGELAAQGLLRGDELTVITQLPKDEVNYGALYHTKWPLLKLAFERFSKSAPLKFGNFTFSEFKKHNTSWLDAYALFLALKDTQGGKSWTEWPKDLRSFKLATSSSEAKKLSYEIEAHQFYQYVFFAQWQRVKTYAKSHGVSIVGDIPIFVAGDSADVWSQPDLFELDQATGKPIAVAGVPPDYFSADGQLWGNPLYAWDNHAKQNFSWWIERLKAAFDLYDIVRIDHFRGFDAYWRIPLPASTAKIGTWEKAPGLDLFKAIKKALPKAKIIAEDLGILTPSVVELREATGLPGMGVLQFAFGGDESNLYLPHNLIANEVIYTGTHDNDTSVGWYLSSNESTRDHARRYLRVAGNEIVWDLIRSAYQSISSLAVIPMQDILALGSEARLNTPGKSQGNWKWRMTEDQLSHILHSGAATYLKSLATTAARN